MNDFEVGRACDDALAHIQPSPGRDNGKVRVHMVAGGEARRADVVTGVRDHFNLPPREKSSPFLTGRLIDPAFLRSVVVAQRVCSDAPFALGKNGAADVGSVGLLRPKGLDFAQLPINYNVLGLEGEVRGFGTGLALKI